MQAEKIQRVLVWSVSLRLAHWSIALSVMLLAATGWLIQNSPMVADGAADVHDFFSVALILGLGLRLWLLFSGSSEVSKWRQLVPRMSTDKARISEMLRFYLTFGRTPLPGWFAHNPLWAPVYLLLLAILFLQVMSGLLMETFPVLWGFYLPNTHELLAVVIFVFFVLHIVAVVFNELKGTGSDISAMINGYRIFVTDKEQQPVSTTVQYIRPDEIKKRGR